ncbi:MAG TPA: rhomboid family intramembrane serine protease [Myxococcales bacterium]|jgi:membrane associated rhomboid family serine protease|nr:rhomboid family intramembrane serine protease [Myxococcales bacterium]
MTPADSLPSPPPAPLTPVQRLALALAAPAKAGAESGAAVLSAEPSHARLRFFVPGSFHVSILPGGDGVEAALAEVISGWQAGALHVVVLGADPKETLRLFKRHRPFWQMKSVFCLHVRDAAGKVHTVAGGKMPLLQMALDRADAMDGAAPEIHRHLQEVQAAGVRSTEDVAAFQQLLQRQKVRATTLLVISCFAVFAAGWALFQATSSTRVMIRMGAMQGELLRQGQWWRLLAPAFLHAGPWHVLLNMLALFSLGSLLEGLLGWRRFLLLYTACALGGSVAILIASPAAVVMGASGAIWGLMGFELYLAWRPGGLFPEMIARQLKSAGGRAVAVNIAISLLPGISFAAHLGGGLVGLGLAASGLLTRGVRPVAEGTPPSAPPALTAGAALSAVALAASLLYGIAWGRPWDFARPELVRVELADGYSAQMPAVHTRIDEREENGVTKTTLGDLYTDGAIYRMLLIPSDPGTVADADQLENLKAELAQQALAGVPRQGAIKVERLGDRQVVTDLATSGDTRVREWSTYQGSHLVVMQVVEIAKPGTAPWEQLAPAIFLSIQPPRAPR